MSLAYMVILDEDALICDFAQYYGLDFDSVQVRRKSILACGLPAESRIFRKMRNEQAAAKAEQEERQRQTAKQTKNNEIIFDSPEDFEKARARFL